MFSNFFKFFGIVFFKVRVSFITGSSICGGFGSLDFVGNGGFNFIE